jgi:hypothetical protein
MKITCDLLPYLFSFVDQEEWKYSRHQNKFISLTDLHNFCNNSKYNRKGIATCHAGETICWIIQTKYVKIKLANGPEKAYQILKEYEVKNHKFILNDDYIRYTSKIVIVKDEWDLGTSRQLKSTFENKVTEQEECNLEKPVQKINGYCPCVIC